MLKTRKRSGGERQQVPRHELRQPRGDSEQDWPVSSTPENQVQGRFWGEQAAREFPGGAPREILEGVPREVLGGVPREVLGEASREVPGEASTQGVSGGKPHKPQGGYGGTSQGGYQREDQRR